MKFKRILAALIIMALASPLLAIDEATYRSQLEYKRNYLQIIVKTRQVREQTGYASSDFYTTIYTREAYADIWGSSSTTSRQREEVLEVTDWYVVKGGVRELSDRELFELTGNRALADQIAEKESSRNRWFWIGGLAAVGGIGVMLAASNATNNQGTITLGGVMTAAGFFISAFSLPQRHYISADVAQEAVDNYNIQLKKKLGLPLDYN